MTVSDVNSEADFTRFVNDPKFETTIIDFTAKW